MSVKSEEIDYNLIKGSLNDIEENCGLAHVDDIFFKN